MVDAVLGEDGGHVCFGYIITEGRVFEEHMGFKHFNAERIFQLFLPFNNTCGEWLNIIARDQIIKAGDDFTVTDAVNILARNFLGFNRGG